MKSLLLPCPAREGEVAFSRKMTEGICCKVQSSPKFAAFESPQALRASSPCAQGEPFVRVNLPKIFVKTGASCRADSVVRPYGAGIYPDFLTD